MRTSARARLHTHLLGSTRLGWVCTKTPTYKDTWALQRHRETQRTPCEKPEPFGAAVFALLGVCTSQGSGHDGDRSGREVGRRRGSSPRLLVQVGLSLVVALQGAASAEPQFPTANGLACLAKASGQSWQHICPAQPHPGWYR